MESIQQSHQRTIRHTRFRDNTVINQGDTYISLAHRPAQAAVHVIPYPRNEGFIRRADIVDQLDELLPRASIYCSAALWGLGGSGKTQIALDYLYRQCHSCSVFWVHADTKATFTHDYEVIARKFGINNLKNKDLLMAVRSRIEAEARWLLVLDNADDLALFGVRQASTRSQSLADFIPRGPKGTVLWTSRDKQIAGTLVGPHRAIEVADMTPNEAKNLLGITTATSEVKDTYELIEDLQYHALAVSQAGAYMRRTSTPVREYICLLREKKKRHKLLEQDEFDLQRKPEVPNSILATWSISIKRIQQECKLALPLLHIMALFDTQKIQWGIIQSIMNYYSPRDDDDKTKQAMVRLQDFSFVNLYEKDEDQYYGMHKLVQEAARYRLRKRGSSEEGGATFWGSKIISEALSYFKERHKRRFSLTALQVIGSLSFLSHKSETASWVADRFLSAHALQVTEWMELCGDRVQVSDRLSHISDFLGDLEKWTEKELVDKRVLKIRQKMLGEKHPKAIESMAALTIAYLGLASRRRNKAMLKFEYPGEMSDHA